MAPASATRWRGRVADAAGPAGDDDLLAADGAGERAVLEQVRVEVALPVVPQRVRVAVQRRHLDAGALQHPLGVAAVELGLERDVVEHLERDAEVAEDRLLDLLHGRDLHRHREHALGQRVDDPLVDPQRELRGVGGLGERVDDLAGAGRLRRDQVEGLPVQVGLVRDVVEGARDVVDRDDVGVAELRAGQRDPLGQQVTQPLDGGEEVVRTVDLVHLAGLAVSDHDGRPIHPPRHRAALAGDLLGLELGPVVGRGELLTLVEHVLAEVAVVVAGGGHRGDVVQVADLQRVGQVDGVLGPLDVEPLVGLVVGGHVVDGREVEEVVDVAGQSLDVLVGHAEPFLAQVTDHRPDAVGAAPALDELVEATAGPLPDQYGDLALSLEQSLDQEAADESRRARSRNRSPRVPLARSRSLQRLPDGGRLRAALCACARINVAGTPRAFNEGTACHPPTGGNRGRGLRGRGGGTAAVGQAAAGEATRVPRRSNRPALVIARHHAPFTIRSPQAGCSRARGAMTLSSQSLPVPGVDLGVDLVERVRVRRHPDPVEGLHHEAAPRTGLELDHPEGADHLRLQPAVGRQQPAERRAFQPLDGLLVARDAAHPIASAMRVCSVVCTSGSEPLPISSQ